MLQGPYGKRQAGFAPWIQRAIKKRQTETVQKNFSQLGNGRNYGNDHKRVVLSVEY